MVVLHRKILLLVAIGILALTSAAGYFLWRQQDASRNKEAGTFGFTRVCDEKLIGRASQQMQSSNFTELRRITDGVTKIEGYDRDQNCLLILVQGTMLLGDLKASRTHLDDLKIAYIPGNYSKAFTTPTRTPKELEATLAFAERAEEAADKNTESMLEDRRKLDQAALEALNAQ